jgi:hypothetical protein
MLHRQHGWLSHTAHLWLYCGIPTLAAVELGIVVLCYRPQRRHRYLAYLAIGTVLLSCVFFVLWSFIGPALTHALQGLSQPYFF